MPFVTTQPGTETNLAWLRSRDGDRLGSAIDDDRTRSASSSVCGSTAGCTP